MKTILCLFQGLISICWLGLRRCASTLSWRLGGAVPVKCLAPVTPSHSEGSSEVFILYSHLQPRDVCLARPGDPRDCDSFFRRGESRVGQPLLPFFLLFLKTKATWLHGAPSPNCGQLTFERWYAPSFRPSEIYTNTTARLERRESLIPKRHNVSTPRQNSKKRETDRPAQSTETCHTFLPASISSHHIPLPYCQSPSMVRGGFLAVTIPQESYSGTVNTVKEGSPATLSSPNTHPFCLGRDGPLPCGSSMPLVPAPNPRERALPFHLTNPAQ